MIIILSLSLSLLLILFIIILFRYFFNNSIINKYAEFICNDSKRCPVISPWKNQTNINNIRHIDDTNIDGLIYRALGIKAEIYVYNYVKCPYCNNHLNYCDGTNSCMDLICLYCKKIYEVKHVGHTILPKMTIGTATLLLNSHVAFHIINHNYLFSSGLYILAGYILVMGEPHTGFVHMYVSSNSLYNLIKTSLIYYIENREMFTSPRLVIPINFWHDMEPIKMMYLKKPEFPPYIMIIMEDINELIYKEINKYILRKPTMSCMYRTWRKNIFSKLRKTIIEYIEIKNLNEYYRDYVIKYADKIIINSNLLNFL
jgi:hypothetical protein